MNDSQTSLDGSTNLVYQLSSSPVSAADASVNHPSTTLVASVASNPDFGLSSSLSLSYSSAIAISSHREQSPTVLPIVSSTVSRPSFEPSTLPPRSTRTSFAKTIFSYTTSSLKVSSSAALSSTSKLAIVNVIPSPHPSHSLNITHSVQLIPSSSSSNSVSATHIPSSTTQLKDQPETGLFTFITVSDYSSNPASTSSSQPSSAPTISNQPSSSPSPSPAKLGRTIKGAVLGTFGAVCSMFILGLLVLYIRRRRRLNYSSVTTTPQSDRRSFTYSGNSSAGETQEIIYKGSRRFRFPQVSNLSRLSRQPLTLSPPATNSYDSKIQFPVGSSVTGSGPDIRISSPVVPPSSEQDFGASLNLPPPQYFPSKHTLISSSPESRIVHMPWKQEHSTSSTRTTSIFPEERSPPSTISARTQPSIPQIRLEYVETQTPSTTCTPAPLSLDYIQVPKPLHINTTPMVPYSGSTFLAPPTPKHTSIVKPAGTTSPPPSTLSPVPPVSFALPRNEKQQETEPQYQSPRVAPTANATQATGSTTFSAKRLTWASTLRANLFNAVQFMNSTPEEDEEVLDDRESEISSLFSETRNSDSESGKSIAAAALHTGSQAGTAVGKAVRTEVKKPLRPQRRTWVIVNHNGGTRPESQSVESLSDAYHIVK